MFTEHFRVRFDRFSDEISKKNYFVCDDVFSDEAYKKLKQNFNKKLDQFKKASIGKGLSKSLSTKIRGDQILWIDGDISFEYKPFNVLLNQILDKSRRELFLPLKRYEAHLSYYQKNTYYLKHKDRHKNSPSRLLSLVFYLNDWKKEDSGELIVYDGDTKKRIEPLGNRVIVFKSELEHEVLKTNKPRKSFTAWFRDDIE